MKVKYFKKQLLFVVLLIIIFTLPAFAESESGTLGSRGDYSFDCSNGWLFDKYVSASSDASYNGNTSTSDPDIIYAFTGGRARVDVTLTDGTNNTDYDDFSGTDYSGEAYVKVHGLNEGSSYCYARVSGVLLFSDGTYSNTNAIEASTLYP